jgi:lysophospholipase
MPHARYLDLPDSEHEILMENDSIRSRFWVAFDAFTT